MKNYNAEKAQKRAEKQKNAMMFEMKNFKMISIVAVIILVFAFLMMLFDFSSVYNSDYGTEVKVSGYNLVASFLTGKYDSANTKLYGDMAVPFNVYAGFGAKVSGGMTYTGFNYLRALSVCSFISLLLLVINFILVLVLYLIKKPQLLIVAIVTTLANAVFFFICQGIGVGMKDASILSIYCQGNPKCSIVSYAILSGLVVMCALIPVVIDYTKYLKIKGRIYR